MTAKEYLSQAYRLDQRIDSKIEQISSLNDLATKCTATISGMPHSHSSSTSTMADTVMKIIALQQEINADIDALVDLKREIITAINGVENPEFKTLLEKRYLCFESWEKIAVDMNYSIDNIYKLHKKALASISLSKTLQ